MINLLPSVCLVKTGNPLCWSVQQRGFPAFRKLIFNYLKHICKNISAVIIVIIRAILRICIGFCGF
jgi:hypothetical protein